MWEERNAEAKRTWQEDVGDWNVMLHDDIPVSESFLPRPLRLCVALLPHGQPALVSRSSHPRPPVTFQSGTQRLSFHRKRRVHTDKFGE